MDPVTGILGGIGLGGSIVGGIMGNNAKKKAARAQSRLNQQAIDLLNSVDIPSIESQLLQLDRLILEGQLTPQQEQAIQQRQTELRNIISDPVILDAQKQVLSDLDNIIQNEGLDDIALAELNQLRNSISQQERASREAVIQNANRRGIGGSGLELASQLMNQQGAAQRASQEGFQVAANAQKRALDALMQKGNYASNLRTQDFNEKARTAEAQDAINRFNVSQRTDAQRGNVNRDMEAQRFNLGRQDEVAKTNLGLSNQEKVAENAAERQNYLDRLNKATTQADILTGKQGPLEKEKGQISADLWAGISKTAGDLGTTFLDRSLKK